MCLGASVTSSVSVGFEFPVSHCRCSLILQDVHDMDLFGWFPSGISCDDSIGWLHNLLYDVARGFAAFGGIDVFRSCIVGGFLFGVLSPSLGLYLLLFGLYKAGRIVRHYLRYASCQVAGSINTADLSVERVFYHWAWYVTNLDIVPMAFVRRCIRLVGFAFGLVREFAGFALLCRVLIMRWMGTRDGIDAYEEMDSWKRFGSLPEQGSSAVDGIWMAALALFVIELMLRFGLRVWDGCSCAPARLRLLDWLSVIEELPIFIGMVLWQFWEKKEDNYISGVIRGSFLSYRLKSAPVSTSLFQELLFEKFSSITSLTDSVFAWTCLDAGIYCTVVCWSLGQWCYFSKVLLVMFLLPAVASLLLFALEVYLNWYVLVPLARNGLNWLSTLDTWISALCALVVEGWWACLVALLCVRYAVSALSGPVESLSVGVRKTARLRWEETRGLVDSSAKILLNISSATYQWTVLQTYLSLLGVASCWCCYLFSRQADCGTELVTAYCIVANLVFWYFFAPVALMSLPGVVERQRGVRTVSSKLGRRVSVSAPRFGPWNLFVSDWRHTDAMRRVFDKGTLRVLKRRARYFLADAETVVKTWLILCWIALGPWYGIIQENSSFLLKVYKILVQVLQWVGSGVGAFIAEVDITISIECSGNTVDVQLSELTTLSALRSYLHELFCPPRCENEMHISFEGQLLETGSYQLCDYGVTNGSLLRFGPKAEITLPLNRIVQGPVQYRTCLVRASEGVYHHFVFTQNITVEHLCEYVRSVTGAGDSSLTLTCDGRTMTNMGLTLFRYGVRDRCIIDVGLALKGGSPPLEFDLEQMESSDESRSVGQNSLRHIDTGLVSSSCRSDGSEDGSEDETDCHSAGMCVGMKPGNACCDDPSLSSCRGSALGERGSSVQPAVGASADTALESSPILERMRASIGSRDCKLFEEAVGDFNFLVDNHVAHFHRIVSRMMDLPEEEKRIFMSLAFGQSDSNSCFDDMEDDQLRNHIATFLTHRAVTRIVDKEEGDSTVHRTFFHVLDQNLQRASRSTSDVDKLLSMNMPFFRNAMGILLRSRQLPYLDMRLRAAKHANELQDSHFTDLAAFVGNLDFPAFPDENKDSSSAFPFESRKAAAFYFGRDGKGCHYRDDKLPYRDHTKIDYKEIRLILLSLEEVLKREYEAYKVKPYKRDLAKMTKYITRSEITEAVTLAFAKLQACGEDLPSTKRDVSRDSGGTACTDKAPAKQELNYSKAAATSLGNRCRYRSPCDRDYNVQKHYDHNSVLLEAQSYEMKGFVDQINNKGIPLDVLFPAGRALREKVGLPADGPEMKRDCPKPSAKLIFLLRPDERKRLLDAKVGRQDKGANAAKNSKGNRRKKSAKCEKDKHPPEDPKGVPHVVAPCVIAISEAICHDLKTKLLEFHNKQPHIRDSTGSGRAFLRAPFLVSAALAMIFPLVSMGANKAMLATAAKAVDVSTIAFANEVQNVLINLTNRGIADIRGNAPPEPKVGPTASAFYQYLSDVQPSEHGDGHKFIFPEESDWDFHDCSKYLEGAAEFADCHSAFFDPILKMDESLSALPKDIPPVRILPDEPAYCSAYLPNRLENSSINRIAADAHYSRHQDCCEERGNQLISNISYDGVLSQVGPSVCYPTNEQMIVLSWIIGEDSMCRKTAVDWWLGKFWLGGCVTENNNWHIQMAGVQYFGIQHSAGFLRSSQGQRSSGSRYIMTFRFMIDPNTHPRAYLEALYLDQLLPGQIKKRKITVLGDYKFTHVGEKLPRQTDEYVVSKRKPWLIWEWAKNFFDVRGQAFMSLIADKLDQTPRQRFKPRPCNRFMVPALSQINNFHRREIPSLPDGTKVRGGRGFEKPVRTIAVGKTPLDVVYHRTLVDHALSQSKLLLVNDKDDVQRSFQPLWLHEDLPCLPGTGLQTFQIPLKVNKQKKELINPEVPNAFQAARMYKNRISSYEKHLDFWKQLRKRCEEVVREHSEMEEELVSRLKLEIEREFEDGFIDLFFNPLQSMGSGGSNQPTGATASQFDTLRSDAPHIVISGPQSLRAPTNEALAAAFRRQNPIAIFLNNRTVFEEEDSEDESIGDGPAGVVPAPCSENDPVSFLSYYCVSKYQSNTETLGTTYNAEFTTTFSTEQSAKFVRRNKYNLSHRKNSFIEFGFTPAFRLSTTITTIFNQLKGAEYQDIPVSENDQRSPNVPIEKVQASVLKRYQYETSNGSSDCGSKRLMNVYAAPGSQTNRECLTSLEAFLHNGYVKDQRGLEWTTSDFPESILDREQVLAAMIEDPLLFDKLSWTLDGELQSRKARFIFDPKTAADIIVFTCAAQAGRGTGLESCTISGDKIWPLSDDATDRQGQPGELPPSKRQRTSKHSSNGSSPPDLSSACSENGALYTVPLMLEGAESLPYALQMRATPGARDRDVSSAFFRNNLRILEDNPIVDEGRPQFDMVSHVTGDNEVLTWRKFPQQPSGCAQQFLLHALFMSTAARLTGNSDVLELFPVWKREMRGRIFSEKDMSRLGPLELALPVATEESVREFSMFLYDYLGEFEANLGPAISKQHERFIPKRFKQECRTALLVLEHLRKYFQLNVSEMSGCPTVSGFVSSMTHVPDKEQRFLLIQTLVRAFSRSGNYQMEPSLYKLFHQVVLDVEGYFPEFAGEVTVESIFPGSGGYEGLASIHFDDLRDRDINSNKRAEGVVKRRLQEMYRQFLAYFKNPEREYHRRIAGLFIDDKQTLRWMITGRQFDLCDVEHFCCKLYIVSMNSHPSRTISEIPQCCNYYSWPRPNPKQWDVHMSESFKKSWEAFVQLMRSDNPLSVPYQLQLHNGTFVSGDAIAADGLLPRQLFDNCDDSPQNAIGMDEDNLSVADPEGEEENLIRTAY